MGILKTVGIIAVVFVCFLLLLGAIGLLIGPEAPTKAPTSIGVNESQQPEETSSEELSLKVGETAKTSKIEVTLLSAQKTKSQNKNPPEKKGRLADSVYAVIQNAKSLARRRRFHAAKEKLANLEKTLAPQKNKPEVAPLLSEISKAKTEIDKMQKQAKATNTSAESAQAYYWKMFNEAQKLYDNKQYKECADFCAKMIAQLEKRYAGFDDYSPIFKDLKRRAERLLSSK